MRYRFISTKGSTSFLHLPCAIKKTNSKSDLHRSTQTLNCKYCIVARDSKWTDEFHFVSKWLQMSRSGCFNVMFLSAGATLILFHVVCGRICSRNSIFIFIYHIFTIVSFSYCRRLYTRHFTTAPEGPSGWHTGPPGDLWCMDLFWLPPPHMIVSYTGTKEGNNHHPQNWASYTCKSAVPTAWGEINGLGWSSGGTGLTRLPGKWRPPQIHPNIISTRRPLWLGTCTPQTPA